MFNYLSRFNNEINVIAPRYKDYFATRFDKPINATDNGFSVSNKYSNGSSFQIANGIITLNKTGVHIAFSTNIIQYLNDW